jgi:apolipoprotein N-acyltransferase
MALLILSPLCSFSVGLIGWWGTLELLPCSLLVFPIWRFARSRKMAALVVTAYYLGAVHQLPLGATNFYGSMLAGAAVWLGISIVMALPWALIWDPEFRFGAVRLLILLALISLPPFGVFGLANPITAAGVLFSGMKWFGLLLCFSLIFLICTYPKIILVLPLLIWIGSQETPGVDVASWSGIITRNNGNETKNLLEQYHQQRDLIALANQTPATKVVFPESIAGTWNDAAARLWSKGAVASKEVLLGAHLDHGAYRENAVLYIHNQEVTALYSQRQPIPISMWNPFRSNSFNANWFEDPVVTLNNERIGFLVCYEQALVWPVLHSALNGSDRLVAISNLWWAGGTRLQAIQRSIVAAWGRLFAIPVTFSFNA